MILVLENIGIYDYCYFNYDDKIIEPRLSLSGFPHDWSSVTLDYHIPITIIWVGSSIIDLVEQFYESLATSRISKPDNL